MGAKNLDSEVDFESILIACISENKPLPINDENAISFRRAYHKIESQLLAGKSYKEQLFVEEYASNYGFNDI